MKTFLYHIQGFILSFDKLSKGKYLLFFLPGLIVTVFYLYLKYITVETNESIELSSDTSWINWIAGVITSGLHKLFSLLTIIEDQIYLFIVLTLLSPFNTLLGEKFDHDLTGFKPETGILRLINDIIRMIFIVIIALALEFLALGAYWLISKIPFIGGPHDAVIYFLIKAFFMGFAFFDFSLERYKKGVFQSLSFAFSKPLGMILTGSIFLLIYEIPYIGIPIAPVITILVSTVVFLYYIKKLPNENTPNTAITNKIDSE